MDENQRPDFSFDEEPAVPETPEVPAKEHVFKKPATRPDHRPDSKTAKSRKLPIVIGSAVALVLIAVIVLLVAFPGPGPAAEKFVKACLFKDIVAVEKYCAYDLYSGILGDMDEEEYFEDVSERYYEDIFSWKDLAKYYRVTTEETLEEEFGEYEITVEATRIKDMSMRALERDLDYYMTKLENGQGFDRDEIDDIKIVNVKVKVKGEDATDRETFTLYMVKMGMSWKFLYSEDLSF